MNTDTAKILFHNVNTDIVKLDYRECPSIAIDVERLSDLYDGLCLITQRCKEIGDAESYSEAHTIGEVLRHFLEDYEKEVGLDVNYPAYETSISERVLEYEPIHPKTE